MCAKWSYKKDVLGVALWFVFPMAIVLLLIVPPVGLAGLIGIIITINMVTRGPRRERDPGSEDKKGD